MRTDKGRDKQVLSPLLWQEGRFMIKVVYEITVDGEKTGLFYIADSKEEAINKHVKRCTELYFKDFNRKPDMESFNGVDAIESMRAYE